MATQHNITNQHVSLNGDEALVWSYAIAVHKVEARQRGSERHPGRAVPGPLPPHAEWLADRIAQGSLPMGREILIRRAAMSRKVALVTGASRGIGKQCAIWLARAGYDVAITARTVTEGEAREHSPTVKASNTKPLPGSLLGTAELIEAEGAKALPVAADLLDPASLGACVATVEERWGRIDVVVHNGRYIGPGHMDVLMDTPVDLIQDQIVANALAPLRINKLVLPGMIRRGSGVIVDISSAAAYNNPTKAAGKGGYGLGYAMSKGAFHRVASVLRRFELEDTGVQVFNVAPGFIRHRADRRRHG